MNKSNILVSFFVGAVLGVGVTFFVMNDVDKDIVKEVVENDAGKEDSKKEFVSTVDVYGGWEYTALSKEIDEWKRGDEMFEESLNEAVEICSYNANHSRLCEKPLPVTSVLLSDES